ncbi:SDR family oxidoreductase [Chitinophaga ginsengisegetis]|uniref:SDR family oxidoreductase n=1 Tax=Chitinophaga ginsengisegetis TaxID=393003 RepID=UPI000DB9D1D6|nr:SDR family oxidoreductase [Chitinophaga ginsengisegetis]MDR6567967.1 NAD(P)-dependent dehydrogenase (short-subunit alcohol dehydrogenase family) [Chitinophaga ginsengisegetis]MDR6647478.1 NAD(P)-dependent dehydrogenase (short-subunit alcohol dehydrogenase family) [Chitinophaga ginsengisegetis]MDR6653828.1 NAD(P)-dependent dehydrogenase (short-subunit alcohol dehydrogenase family) [Chitinophaga ginsengisegetis]
MKKVLITGANKSIGFETTRQLLQKGYYVYLGSRNLANGLEAVEKLKAEGLNEVEAIQIDVSNQASVDAARAEIGKKTSVLDVLINNAGISGGLPQTATGTDIAVFKAVFETNLYGVVRVTRAFIDLLQSAPQPRIVNVSSSMASLTLNSDPTWPFYHHKGAAYLPSKTALNMYTVTLAYELRDTPFKVNAIDPGFIATDFNNHRGTGSVEEAGARLVKYATIGDDGPTGRFFSEENNPVTGEIPW